MSKIWQHFRQEFPDTVRKLPRQLAEVIIKLCRFNFQPEAVLRILYTTNCVLYNVCFKWMDTIQANFNS